MKYWEIDWSLESETKARERPHASKVTKTDEICRPAESMLAQMKPLKDTQETDVNIVNKSERESSKKTINHRWRQRALGQGKQCETVDINFWQIWSPVRAYKGLPEVQNQKSFR